MDIEAVQAFYREFQGEEWWPLFVVALHTGCRIGELTGLRWSDLDADKGILRVERSLQRINREWIESTPKTRSGRRVVALTSVALEAFQRQ